MMIDPDAAAPPLLIRLFGPTEVSVRGNPLPHLRSRKGYWLLALLALRAGREVERTWLLGTLWPHSSEAAARASLRTSLKDLRHALGPEAGRLFSPTPRTLYLDLRDTEVDVIALDSALARADGPWLERAVHLYRGPLLEGCAEEWALPERQAREQGYLRALESLAARALAGGNPAAAERYLRLAVAVDPPRESAQRELMQVLAARGSYAAAVQTYRDLRLRLHREVNAAPDPQTQALFEQIRAAAQCARDSAPPVGAPLRPISNLPAPSTLLLGREGELKAVQEVLDEEAVRLLTVTGTGGTGKTRLAVEAASLRGDFKDGMFFVNLAPVRDPGLVTSTIAQTLGVREAPRQPLLASLKEYLRDKAMLLLLDNFEHLLPAAPLVAELLATAPRLKILVTSRAALRLRGERLFPLPPLALPPLVETGNLRAENAGRGDDMTGYGHAGLSTLNPQLSTLTSYAAVQLFIQRARDVRPDFALTNENVPAVAEICRRLDGLPLAIELAAARIRLFSPQALLSRMESRLHLLVEGARDLPARQQTLRDTIAWSYNLLDASERQLFRRLAIFMGGCTPQAAETVAAVARAGAKSPPSADVVAGLRSLLDQSLLRQEDGEDGQPRFSMLETVREFAEECLTESREREHLRKQHAAYFLQLAEQAETELRGADAPVWVARLEADNDNLRAALAWCREEPDGAESGLRLAGSLWQFWSVRSYHKEGLQHLEGALAHGRAMRRTALRATALNRAGDLAYVQANNELAHSLLRESLGIWRELGDRGGEAGVLNTLGLVAAARALPAEARSCYEQALAVNRELGLRAREASNLRNLGSLAQGQGDYAQARFYAEQSLRINSELGYRTAEAGDLINLGCMAMEQGDYRRARPFFEQALVINRGVGNRAWEAHTLSTLGRVARKHGYFARSLSYSHQALAISREIGHRWEEAGALQEVGLVSREQADYDQARFLLVQALEIWFRWGDMRTTAATLEALASVATAQKQPQCAARLYGAAASLRERTRFPLPPGDRDEYEHGLAAAHAALGEEAFTRACAEGRAMTLAEAVDHARGIGSAGL